MREYAYDLFQYYYGKVFEIFDLPATRMHYIFFSSKLALNFIQLFDNVIITIINHHCLQSNFH